MACATDLDPQPLPWMPPHIMPRVTYIQDPVTSCWRIDLSRTCNLPSPAHPRGRRESAASPWVDDPWSFTDEERKQRAARAINFYEMFIQRRPLTPEEGEETLEERRERLLNSESEVEAMQEKERILESSYGMPVPRRPREDGEGGGEGVGEASGVVWAGVELRKAAAPDVGASVAGGESNGSIKHSEERDDTDDFIDRQDHLAFDYD